MASRKHQGHGMLEWMHTYREKGFTKSFVDSNLYIKVVKGESVIILLYVDDLLLTSVEGRIEECKKQIAT